MQDAAVSMGQNSLGVCRVLIMVCRYGCYLLFQLKTHASFFKESTEESTPALSLVAAMATLTGVTIIVAVSSE